MHFSEVAKIFKKPGEVRLKLFVEAVAKEAAVYGIADEEGWALLGDDDVDEDVDILPLFYDYDLAEAFRKGAGFEDSTVEKVELDELMEWLDELQADGLMIAVCPNPEFEGPILEPNDLKEDLTKQLLKK